MCQFCERKEETKEGLLDPTIIEGGDLLFINWDIPGTEGVFQYAGRTNFCPVCGRPLVEEIQNDGDVPSLVKDLVLYTISLNEDNSTTYRPYVCNFSPFTGQELTATFDDYKDGFPEGVLPPIVVVPTPVIEQNPYGVMEGNYQ